MFRKEEKPNIENQDLEKEEMHFEEVHPFCDGCGADFFLVDLQECPSGEAFCEDCCRSIFDTGGCREHTEECERAAKMMSEHLKKYAKERKFGAIKSWPHVHVSDTRVFCLAESRYPPNKELNDEVINFDENLTFFEGREHILVKGLHQNVSFDKEYIDEIKEAFHDLGSDFLGYSMLKNKPLLIIWGIGVWAALAPCVDEPDYAIERADFIRSVKEGHKFFDITKENGLIIVGVEEMDFDWSQLDQNQFVELCYDIFKTFPTMTDVRITEGSSDLGQDIRAIETVETLLGKEKKIWTIQCKHFPSRKVNPSDIQNIPKAYPKLKYDVFCLMTSNFVSPGCQRLLESWETIPSIAIKTVFWDRKKIEDYLSTKPHIYARYFVKKG